MLEFPWLFILLTFLEQQEPDNPASNIPQLHDYSAIIEVWEELASRVHRPAEFLSIWHRVEDYERYVRNAALDNAIC